MFFVSFALLSLLGFIYGCNDSRFDTSRFRLKWVLSNSKARGGYRQLSIFPWGQRGDAGQLANIKCQMSETILDESRFLTIHGRFNRFFYGKDTFQGVSTHECRCIDLATGYSAAISSAMRSKGVKDRFLFSIWINETFTWGRLRSRVFRFRYVSI